MSASTPEEAARRVFGERAAFYTTSPAHTDPQVLARVVAFAQPRPDWTALDVATGTGHTAFALAPYVRQAVGVDLTPAMLAEAKRLQEARQIANVSFQVADVHHLPFEDESFDLVTARRAPHHFSNIARALTEMGRVLRRGGRLVIDDRSVPEDDFVDTTMNLLDWYHDESHIREYRPSEWVRMLNAAGLQVEHVEPYVQSRPLTSLTQGVSSENVAKIEALLQGLTGPQRRALGLTEVNGERHINHWYVTVAAVKPAG